DSEDGRNAYASIKRGDMSECSFGFTCDEGDDSWDVETDERGKRMARRTVRNIAVLSDVSAVTFPAYDKTNIHAREQRSEVVIPEKFIVEPETDSIEAIERRRQLLNISLL